MWKRLKANGRPGVFWIAGLALALIAGGCGSDQKTESKGIIVQNPQRHKPVMPATPPSVPVTTPTPAEPEVPDVAQVPREVTFEEAEAAFHSQEYAKAVELFTLYVDRKSENPWGFYMLGLSAWKAGELATAEHAFETSLALDPKHVKSWLNLARVLLDQDRREDALARINEAIALDPQSGVAYRVKGRVFDKMALEVQAVDAYRKAIEIDNADAWAMNNMALIFIEEGLFENALPPLARAVELGGENATFLNNLGMALERTGHYRTAEAVYRQAVDIDTSFEKASLNLARIEQVLEDPELEPVDLTMLAQAFVDDIASWSVATIDVPDTDDDSNGVVGVDDSTVVSESTPEDTPRVEN